MQNSKLLLLCWLTIKNQITEYEQFKRTLPVESIIVFSQIFSTKLRDGACFGKISALHFAYSFWIKKTIHGEEIDCFRAFGFVLEQYEVCTEYFPCLISRGHPCQNFSPILSSKSKRMFSIKHKRNSNHLQLQILSPVKISYDITHINNEE